MAQPGFGVDMRAPIPSCSDAYSTSSPNSLKGSFLDYGAGKGRALIVALWRGFEKVIGIELSPVYCAIANNNVTAVLAKYPTRTVEIIQGDAVDFDMPDDVSVAYFFDPFGREVMPAVIERILKSLHRLPREFHVVYANPRFVDLFIISGFVRVCGGNEEGVILRWTADF